MLCQVPPEAGHPPHTAVRLKEPAYGINDAPGRWWNVLDKALCTCGMIPTRTDRCGYVLYSTQTCGQFGTKRALHRCMLQMTSHSIRVCDHREMQHLSECWIPLKEAQLQANPWQESFFVDDLFGSGGIDMEQRVVARLQQGCPSWFRMLE